MRYFRALADLLLPRKCVVCARRLNVDENHLCLHCMADFPYTRFWQMEHNPMANRFNVLVQKGFEELCARGESRFGNHEKYLYAVALFFYASEAGYRHIPYRIKYHGDIDTGKFFGSLLGKRLKESPFLQDVNIVVPVPLHWRRKWSRGYNQAEVIAAEVASEMGVPMRSDILKRVRNTRTQTKLDLSAKAENVKGAFSVKNMPAEEIRHILLIDDVFTTGNTLFACFTALRSVFPPSVRISVATLGFVGGT